MKAIIPVAGYGTRLLPHTKSIQKSLLPIAGKPTLDFIVNPLLEGGIKDITFIIGHLGEQIIDHIKSFSGNFEFVVQKEQLGLGHAILQGLEENDSPVIIQLGDTLFQTDFLSFADSKVNRIAVMEVEDPTRFGIVETKGDRILALHEKPKNPPTNLAISGLYSFTSEQQLKSAIELLIQQNIQTNGEYQLTDAMSIMLQNGLPFEVSKEKYYDTGVPATFLETNRKLLRSSHGEYPGSTIIEPVYIGENCQIENSTIGPYVTIMNNSMVKNCTIKDSVILSGTNLINQTFDSKIVGGDGSKVC